MRRFRRHSGGRRAKEPVSWLRSETFTRNATLGLGTALQTVIFDPESVVFGAVDTRITVRRIKLEVFPLVTVTVNAAAQVLICGMGVFMGDASLPQRNPNLVTEEDQETDWLYLSHRPLTIAAGAASYTLENFQRGNTAWDAFAPDIRSMRKLDNQQVLLCTIAFKQLDITDFTAPTVTVGASMIDASVLYSRTMRR